jgi:hypothetical protein
VLERVRNHIKEHKIEYACAATFVITAVGVAGITALIMRGRYEALAPGGAYGLKTIDTSVTMRPLSIFSDQNNIVTVIHRDGRGHPGYIIRNIETGELFVSQREAAEAFGISENILSKHLAGKIDNAEGHLFERLALAA